MAKTKSTQKPAEELSYEEALVELESIVESLEGDASRSQLEDSMKLFERGQALAAHCSALLESAQLKVHKLVGESVVAFEEETE